MGYINFQDNFSTNLTSNTTAGATTTPLNSIPSVDAPYYIALDADNDNDHFEIVLVTSDTATNINHAANSYAHTTAESVKLVTPSVHLNTMQNFQRGFLVNGKLSVTDSGSGLVVAIKTLAGNDPSTTDPVYVRIGDTMRSITSALSVTKADGTNWCNAGSSELATKEIDYFVYLGYNATDGVVIGFSRFPGANSYDDFSTTSTNEKYCAISTITNATATDYYEVIGRFAATLSAGAGYTWSVPTYTAKNLIQRPIYETRTLVWVPQYTGFSVNPSSVTALYKVISNYVEARVLENGNGTSNSTSKSISFPFASKGTVNMGHIINTIDNGTQNYGKMIFSTTNTPAVYPSLTVASWTNTGNCRIETLGALIKYEI